MDKSFNIYNCYYYKKYIILLYYFFSVGYIIISIILFNKNCVIFDYFIL